MRGQPGFFDVDERLKEVSAKGDALERLNRIVDFELFRDDLARAVPRSDGSKGGRPPFDLVFMFKVLILQASHSLSDERTGFLIKDRLSFMRFLGLGLSDPVPDANTIWTFREALTRAEIAGKPAIAVLFSAYEAALRQAASWRWAGRSSTPRADPNLDRHRRGPPRRGAAAQSPLEGQYRQRRLGRYGLPLEGQRGKLGGHGFRFRIH